MSYYIKMKKNKKKPKKFKPGYIFKYTNQSYTHKYVLEGVILKVKGDKFYFKLLKEYGDTFTAIDWFKYDYSNGNQDMYIQANTDEYKQAQVIGKADMENIDLLYTNKDKINERPKPF